jgi:hypothetical protein
MSTSSSCSTRDTSRPVDPLPRGPSTYMHTKYTGQSSTCYVQRHDTDELCRGSDNKAPTAPCRTAEALVHSAPTATAQRFEWTRVGIVAELVEASRACTRSSVAVQQYTDANQQTLDQATADRNRDGRAEDMHPSTNAAKEGALRGVKQPTNLHTILVAASTHVSRKLTTHNQRAASGQRVHRSLSVANQIFSADRSFASTSVESSTRAVSRAWCSRHRATSELAELVAVIAPAVALALALAPAPACDRERASVVPLPAL